MQVVVQDQVDQAESPGGVPLRTKAVMDIRGLRVMVFNVAVAVVQAQIALEAQVVAVTEVFPAMVEQAQLTQDQGVAVAELVHLEVKAAQVL
jgi:hypothetical protein